MASASVPPASTLINSKGYCVFCLKKADQQGHSNGDENGPSTPAVELSDAVDNLVSNKLYQRFCSNIGNYLGTNYNPIYRTHPEPLQKMDEFLNKDFDRFPKLDITDVCQDCSRILEHFCHLYFQMKSMELQVEWQVRKLKTIMAFAERAATRRNHFKEQFLAGNREDELELEKIEKFRKELLRKCTLKLGQTFPRIFLKRRHEKAFVNTAAKTATPKRENSKKTKTSVAVQTENSIVSSSNSSQVQQEEHNDSTINLINHSSATSLGIKDNTTISNTDQLNYYYADTMKNEPRDEVYDAVINSPLSSASFGEDANDDKDRVLNICAYPPTNEDVNQKQVLSTTDENDIDIEIKPVILRITSVRNTTTSSISVIPQLPSKPVQIETATSESSSSSFRCSRCNESFSTEITLKSHENCGLQTQVSGQNMGFSTEELNSASQPIESVPSNPDKATGVSDTVTVKTDQCKVCKKRIKIDSMEAHLSLHTNEKHHKCKYCHTSYTSAYHLKRHKVTVMHKVNKKKIKRKRRKEATVVRESKNNEIDTTASANNPNIKIVKIIYVTESLENNSDEIDNNSTVIN
ncbi:unnamed protein product [Orchesella dallaii]|uniref:C2H2-type domain-containing protein n=1 Tax=Orchesella dallaii TaxID=48710 RepID=A0ABP1RZW1_9HEXA